jgi:N-acetylglucosamine kinase-like BadF-type ATPase
VALFLGVDGGGSKTAFLLLDDGGTVVAEVEAGTSYYQEEGVELVNHVLADGIGRICTMARIRPEQIERAFFGLPGYGEARQDIPRLNEIPESLLGHTRYSCGNDMICGFAGSLAGHDGINVISGTGSMTYGERNGKGVRVGGWGELFGDEGSAYWIAVRGLNVFTRMSDGRIPRGPIYYAIKESLNVEEDFDVIDLIHRQWSGNRKAIAGLAKTIVNVASSGDPMASQIMTDASFELAEIVNTTRTLLDYSPDDVVSVSYSGGVFGAESIRTGFESAMQDLSLPYEVTPPMFGPSIGAALYAAKESGIQLDKKALQTLNAHTSKPLAS